MAMRTWVLLFAVTGCAADDLCADPEATPALEVDAGAVLAIGPQGGFHVWAQVAMTGACGDRARLDWEAVTADTGEPVAAGSAPLGPADDQDPLPLQLCPAPIGIDLVDRAIILRAALAQDGPALAAAEQTLTLRCPDDRADVRNTCLLVCNGVTD